MLDETEHIIFNHSGRIITLENESIIQFSELIKQLSKADYIILGEAHDNPNHHALQQRILAAIIATGNRPAVVFEMFNREDSGIIASHYRKYPNEPDQIAKAVRWDESGWPAWNMYRPIIKTAMDAELPVIAGNLSRQKAIQIVIQGQQILQLMEKKTALQMGLLKPLGKNEEQILRKIITQTHNGMPLPMVSAMVTAQRVRDATLAESMIIHNRGEGVILITGKEHARSDYGVPFYLRHRESDAHIVSLAFEDENETTDNKQQISHYPKTYDFIWALSDISASESVAHQ